MLIIGLLSGTSADAIDAALVRFTQNDTELSLTLVAYHEHPYPPPLHARLERLLTDATGGPAEICELHVLIGAAFAEAAMAVATAAGLALAEVDLIASHGQTVYHQVAAGHTRSTLQLGSPAVIAERTGCTTIADFRSRDIAAGGEGAPLAPLLDTLLCAHPERHRALLNIGGIANLTLVPAGDPAAAIACDTGPGNTLIDGAVRIFSGGAQHYDRDGTGAASGMIDGILFSTWLTDPYFARSAPKSTGREYFDRRFLAACIAQGRARGCSDADLLATLTALTARSIAAACRTLLPYMPHELFVSGGGAHNPTLMHMLADALPAEIALYPFDTFGLPANAKEAVLFALLGYFTLHGWPGNLPGCTGARHPVVLGSITPGDQYGDLVGRILRAPQPPATHVRIG